MAWRTDLEGWGRHLDLGPATYAGLANAIAEFEPLTMIVNPGEVRSAQRALAGTVDIMEIDFESAWIRDSGPLVVVDETGRRLGVDFGFNGWGERHKCEKTAAGTATVLERLGIERVSYSICRLFRVNLSTGLKSASRAPTSSWSTAASSSGPVTTHPTWPP